MTPGRFGVCCLPQKFEGPFSTVSKPIFATKGKLKVSLFLEIYNIWALQTLMSIWDPNFAPFQTKQCSFTYNCRSILVSLNFFPFWRCDLEASEKKKNRENNEHLLPRPLTSNCSNQINMPPKHRKHYGIKIERFMWENRWTSKRISYFSSIFDFAGIAGNPRYLPEVSVFHWNFQKISLLLSTWTLKKL